MAVGAKFQSNLAEFQDFRYEWRYDTSSRRFRAILPFFIPVPVPSTISRPLSGDLPILAVHRVADYKQSFSTFFTLMQYLDFLHFFLNFAADLQMNGFFLFLSIHYYIINYYAEIMLVIYIILL